MIGQTISHYKVLEKLGEGGMGVVYKAEDTKLKRIVALKFLPSLISADDEAKQRFIHEAQAASALNHTNICSIHTIEEYIEPAKETAGMQQFIDMEFVEGKTLGVLLKEKELSLKGVVDITLQIAEGLNAAHKKGIVHRDIKPDNVMVTDEGLVKIMDFGLAKLKGSSKLTKTHSTLGTLSYMSPEQARGEKVDERTDIWSLGIVLYEMLAGLRPFRSEYDQAVVYSILNEEPKPLKSLRIDVPTELEQMVEKALQKDIGKRFKNVGELLSELSAIKKKHDTEHEKVHPEAKKVLPSIAVLPFVNMSPDPENEYFSDGLAEELINGLSKLEGLHVVARTSAFRFRGKDLDIREIGKQLNVNTVLEGSVRKAGNKLRVTAQLINVADGYHLWSERYDRELEDVFVIQDEISLAIVNKLKIKLLGDDKAKFAKRYTENFEVYDLYLKGRHYLNSVTEEGIRKSLVCFQQAIKKDPSFALAYVGVASVYNALAVVGLVPSYEAMPKAKSELLKALELNDSLAEAHAWLGTLYLQYEWDWSSAERELKRAIELKPNSPAAHQFYAEYLIVTGDMDQASVEVERARDLDPLSTIPNTILAYQLFVSHRYDKVIEHCRKMLKAEPSFLLQLHLWRALRKKNMLDEAFVECKKLFTLFLNREVNEAMECGYAESGYKCAMRMGAQKLAEQSKVRYVSPYLIATLFSHAEDDNEALHWLEKAYEERDQVVYSMGVDPDWDRVRSNPRFTALLKKIGLGK